jgi:hypothetical protein
MPFAALLIGALLIIVAFNNSFPALVSELETDIPGYFKWAAAIAAIVGLGYIPGLRTPSRYLLGLVLLVILLTNYSQIYAGFTSFASAPGSGSGTGAAQPAPAASYIAANAPAAASGTGTTSAGVAASVTPQGLASAASTVAANPLSPSAYLSAFGSSGFGGIV